MTQGYSPDLFDPPPKASAPIPLQRQAERIAQILLGKRSSLERFSKPGRHKWPDAELDQMRVAIMELEAVHETLADLCQREGTAG